MQEPGEGVLANAEEGQVPFDGFDVPLDQPYDGGMDMELGMNMEPDIGSPQQLNGHTSENSFMRLLEGPFGTPQPAPHRHSSEVFYSYPNITLIFDSHRLRT